MSGQNEGASDQRVTNATLLLEIRHLGEKLDEHARTEKERAGDHEKRIRALEESNTISRTLLGVWNGLNTAGLVLGAFLGFKP